MVADTVGMVAVKADTVGMAAVTADLVACPAMEHRRSVS